MLRHTALAVEEGSSVVFERGLRVGLGLDSVLGVIQSAKYSFCSSLYCSTVGVLGVL